MPEEQKACREMTHWQKEEHLVEKYQKQMEKALKGIPVAQVKIYDESGNETKIVYVFIGDRFTIRYNPLLGESTEWEGGLDYAFRWGVFQVYMEETGVVLDFDHLVLDDDFEILEVLPGKKEEDNAKQV